MKREERELYEQVRSFGDIHELYRLFTEKVRFGKNPIIS